MVTFKSYLKTFSIFVIMKKEPLEFFIEILAYSNGRIKNYI
jgi:hypothetical protein